MWTEALSWSDFRRLGEPFDTHFERLWKPHRPHSLTQKTLSPPDRCHNSLCKNSNTLISSLQMIYGVSLYHVCAAEPVTQKTRTHPRRHDNTRGRGNHCIRWTKNTTHGMIWDTRRAAWCHFAHASHLDIFLTSKLVWVSFSPQGL